MRVTGLGRSMRGVSRLAILLAGKRGSKAEERIVGATLEPCILFRFA